MVRLIINRKHLKVTEGTTVLRAAEKAGIIIPTLCDHPDLTPYGGCRLCVVEVKGARTPMASCTLQVTEGMIIKTESPALTVSRRMILELLLSNYYNSGYTDGQKEDTQLMRWVHHYGVDPALVMVKKPRYKTDSDPNPFVWVDFNKCIVCTRCIRACAEIQGRFVWNLAERGIDTRIVAGIDTTMIEARCESCGACVAYCPTGALDNKMSVGLGQPDHIVTTTCAYCGVGCQLDLNIKDGRIIRVTSNPTAPVNGMALCVKGRYGYDFVHHSDRLTRPRVRRYLLDGKPKPKGEDQHHQARGAYAWVDTDWETALNISATQLLHARDTFGADSLGILTSAKCTNEENYLMNKFARQVIGTNNIDHCARL